MSAAEGRVSASGDSPRREPRVELRVELLVGTQVTDVHGERVGRIEELVAEQRGAVWVVTEYHLGAAVVFERVMHFVALLPPFHRIPFRTGRIQRVSWERMDLSDPEHPRLHCARAELDPPSAASEEHRARP